MDNPECLKSLEGKRSPAMAVAEESYLSEVGSPKSNMVRLSGVNYSTPMSLTLLLRLAGPLIIIDTNSNFTYLFPART